MAAHPTRARDIFLAAVELPPSRWTGFVAAACGPDDDLRGEVEALLAAHAAPDSILEQRPVESTDDTTPFDPVRQKEAVAHEDPGDGLTGTYSAAPAARRKWARAELGSVIGGRYTLVDVIGEGGMGVVYLAVQMEPVKRQVALKLIKAGMESKAVYARFDAERQALALMDHPSIARVYDGGTTPDGQPFFVMELVNGIPLTRYCDINQLPLDARLRLFVQVCQAVQHAHQKGIIHRDLKPTNILVTEVDGRPTPKVIDFGVAKATDHGLTDLTMTDIGAIVGTPSYMSPEQADPDVVDIDTRTDVYALGIVMYELLTGTPPISAKQFKRGAVLEMLRMVRESEPPPPSAKLSTIDDLPNVAANRRLEPARLARSLRGELDWVVMKAIEKDRQRRYETANGLARDIQRFLADEVVEARPPSFGYRLKKFVKRNKVQTLATALILFLLVAGIVGTTRGLIEARTQEKLARDEAGLKEKALRAEAERVLERDAALSQATANANKARDEADRANEQKLLAEANLRAAKKAQEEANDQRRRAADAAEATRQNLYYAQMHLAQQAWREHRGLRHMRELLTEWIPQQGASDRRGWEWFYLNSLPYANVHTLREKTTTNTYCVIAWHRGSGRMAEATSDGSVRVWDIDQERTTLVLKGTPAVQAYWGGTWLAWSPDGKSLALGCADGSVHIWDATSGTKLQTLSGRASTIFAVEYSSDGTRIAAWHQDGTISIWDPKDGQRIADVTHPGAVTAGAWSPDDKFMATGHIDGSITISSAKPGDTIVTLRGHIDQISRLAWSPDSSRLASGSVDFTAKLWDVENRKVVVGPLRHSHGITAVEWLPDGARLATASMDQTIKIWNGKTGEELGTLRGHTETVCSIAWGPNDRIAAACDYGSLKVWDSPEDQEYRLLPNREVRQTAVAWHPDGKVLASAGDDGRIRVWDAQTRKELMTINGHSTDSINTQFGLIRSLAWSPDGKFLASAGLDNATKVWNMANGRQVFGLPTVRGSVWVVAWSPDGTQLAAGSQDGSVRIVTGIGQKPRIRIFKAHEPSALGVAGLQGVRSLAWNPKGDQLATGGAEGVVKLWDPQTGTELAQLPGHNSAVFSVSFNPDGTRLASSGFALINICDVQTGQLLKTLRGHNDFIDAVVWNADGTRLASAGIDNTARIWDPTTGEETFVLRGKAGMFHDVSWHPHGTQLAAASNDGHIWIWNATRGFERDATPRAIPSIERALATGKASREDRRWFAHVFVLNDRHKDALAAVKDDATGLVGLAKEFIERGQSVQATEARNRARPLLERHLAAEPDNAAHAAELADLLLLNLSNWTAVPPTEMTSKAGATLTVQRDGSVLASGINMVRDVYTLSSTSPLDRVTAVRLDVLTDPSLPHSGPGRHETGNFHLRAFRLYRSAPGGERIPVALDAVWASYAYEAWDADIAGVLNEQSKKVWHVFDEIGQPHSAIFLVREPTAINRGTPYIVELSHSGDEEALNLGRFRLSFSDVPNAFAIERHRAATKSVSDPWDKLALAYRLVGDRPAVAALAARRPTVAVALGDTAALDRDWGEAVNHYRKASEGLPTDRSLLSKLAQAYVMAGRTSEAVPLLAKIAADNPKDTILSLRVAALQAWFGLQQDLVATRKHIDAFAKENNEFYTAERAAKAFSLIPSSDKEVRQTALHYARKAVKVGKNGSWHMLSLGMAEYRNGNFEAASQAFSTAADTDPNNVFLTQTGAIYKAMILFQQGKQDEARKVMREVSVKMPPLPIHDRNPLQGGAHHDHLILWLAHKEAKALIGFDDSDPGLVLERLETVRKSAREDSSELTDALLRAGIALLNQKMYREAEPLLRECLTVRERQSPDDWATFEVFSLLGTSLVGQQKFEEAERMLLKGYQGMKTRENAIPPDTMISISEAIDRLIELYMTTKKPDELHRWQTERAKYSELAPPPRVKSP